MAEAGAKKTNALWDFTTWAYALPGVEKACLSLQNRLNADVNIVLFCCWLAYRGAGTSNLAKYLAGALKLSREWQRNLIEPLRTGRKNVKDMVDNGAIALTEQSDALAIAERVKQCELDLEQLQNAALYALVIDGSDEGVTRAPAEQKDDARNNLTVYFAAMNIKLDPLGETHVMRILTAVFGG
jgi:uncharacterized protein (TIGR02444 family)